MAIDKEKAREFLRRLNELETEFGLFVGMDGTDGEEHMYITAPDAGLEEVPVSHGYGCAGWVLEEDIPPVVVTHEPPKHIPTKAELKRLGRCR